MKYIAFSFACLFLTACETLQPMSNLSEIPSEIYVSLTDTITNSVDANGSCTVVHNISRFDIEIRKGLTKAEFRSAFYHEYGHYIELSINRSRKSLPFSEMFAEAFSALMIDAHNNKKLQSVISYMTIGNSYVYKVLSDSTTSNDDACVISLLDYIILDDYYIPDALEMCRHQEELYFKTK